MTSILSAITRFFSALTEWSNGTHDRRRHAISALYRAYHREVRARQRIVFRKEVFREYVRQNLYSPYIGTELTAIIRQEVLLMPADRQKLKCVTWLAQSDLDYLDGMAIEGKYESRSALIRSLLIEIIKDEAAHEGRAA